MILLCLLMLSNVAEAGDVAAAVGSAVADSRNVTVLLLLMLLLSDRRLAAVWN